MRVRSVLAGAAAVAAAALTPALAGEDAQILRLATCQDSWLEWSKKEPQRLDTFGAQFRGAFTHKDNEPFSTPKAATTIAGLHIVQVYPESVGMGVGFSVLVDGSFDKTRTTFEKVVHAKLGKCDDSDGMKTCELDIAEQKTLMAMAENGTPSRTLVGCYYYYAK